MSTENLVTSVDDARKVLAESRSKREEECRVELNELLKKHNCALVSHQELVNGIPKGPANMVVVAND